jgi:hypothetical protein
VSEVFALDVGDFSKNIALDHKILTILFSSKQNILGDKDLYPPLGRGAVDIASETDDPGSNSARV